MPTTSNVTEKTKKKNSNKKSKSISDLASNVEETEVQNIVSKIKQL